MNSGCRTARSAGKAVAVGELERELSELIGADRLRDLLAMRGGTRIWVPQEPHGKCTLVVLLGVEAAQAIIDYYGGGYLDLPTGTALGQKARRERAIQLLQKGWPVTAVAAAVGVCERTVWTYKGHLAARLPQAQQLDLFRD